MAGMFKAKTPKTPELPEPTRMPDPDGARSIAARSKAADAKKIRGGRESTILSQAVGGKLGAAS